VRLRGGERLGAVCLGLQRALGVAATILPMSDDPVRTEVRTDDGWLEFQDYFVRRRCAPRVRQVAYDGAAVARPHPEIIAALADPQLRAIVICPSNPYLSIEPILAVAGMRAAIAACPAPVVAVSPIIGGRAVKGPTAKMMTELGVPVTAAAIARRYADLIDAYVLDEIDAAEAARLSIPATPLPTLMTTLQDRERLARQVLACADAVRSVPA
jgi:LPPG:FO 2-phospho-L-lactate transferase